MAVRWCLRYGLSYRDVEELLAAVQVYDFAAEPMMFNPAAEQNSMGAFWLSDVRPRADAHLVPFDADDQSEIMRYLQAALAVTTMPPLSAARLRPTLRRVTLLGADPLVFDVAYRRTDRRGSVRDGRAFSRAWSASMRWLPYCSVTSAATGTISSSTRR